MSPPRKPPSVASFAPELFATLLSGATKTRLIRMPYRFAVRFRMRLYQLRHAMRVEEHPEHRNVHRAFIRIVWGEAARRLIDDPIFGPPEPPVVRSSKRNLHPKDGSTPCIVVVGPQDSDYTDALRSAGIEISVDPKRDPLAGL